MNNFKIGDWIYTLRGSSGHGMLREDEERIFQIKNIFIDDLKREKLELNPLSNSNIKTSETIRVLSSNVKLINESQIKIHLRVNLNIPDKWCIKSSIETNKELREWFSKVNNREVIGNTSTHYHYPEISKGLCSLTNRDFNYKEISIEQFRMIKDVIHKEEFILPKNWHVVVTKENQEVLSKWRYPNSNSILEINKIVGECGIEKSIKGYTSSKIIKGSTYDFGIEITFEQFKQYVLKEKPEIPISENQEKLYQQLAELKPVIYKSNIGEKQNKYILENINQLKDYGNPVIFKSNKHKSKLIIIT